MIKGITTITKNYSIIFLGGIIFILYFWNRFIRERTSKLLPLNLSILGFLILLYVCGIFIYIVILLIKPRQKNVLIEKVIGWLFPRIILLTALFVDVFGHHQLHYKYQVMLFGILLFLNRYIRYSLKDFKNTSLEKLMLIVDGIWTDYYPGVHPAELAEDYDPNGEDEDDYDPYMYLPLDVFIKFQTESIVYRNTTNRCDITPSDLWYNILEKKYSNILQDNDKFLIAYRNEKDIDAVLTAFDNEKSQQAKALFQKYENKLNKKGPINADKWLEDLKTDNKGAYPYVKKLVDAKYNNEDNKK